MKLLTLVPLALSASGLAACAGSLHLPPTQVIRYHLGEPIARGTIVTQPVGAGPASLEYKTYAAAVETQLLRNGYAAPAIGATPQFYAEVSFTRLNRPGPPRSSPFSIGLGGGSFSGGRHGGVGLGGGVEVPVGGARASTVIVTELSVTIRRRVDQSPVWEGHAQSYSDASKPEADAGAQADRLAAAVFTGFPGDSGRTIEVK